ncbi:pre-mRNA-splicing factor ISY1 homolog [Salvia splendens]|uniref:pre-mRNA-splicing factor ISY1 homolog n=1 Tax=Salvia splendens TaxID=180675 RepID=UPI00110374D6|nr:pre-mRNA-splicing factor ISY1 homolog [Salvia splendens]
MARNEEKAQSMLNHFITMKEEEKRPPKQHRPYLASECCDLAEADKLGQQIMHEISRKVAEIQNEGLGEHCIRGLNDEIDKLIQEKVRWERRIVELRGHNYSRYSAKMTDLDGNIVDVPNPSGRGPGYRYFGAAKKLPGVRELFEKPPELRKRPTRYDIYKRIDDDLVPPADLLTRGNAQELIGDPSRRLSAINRRGDGQPQLPLRDKPEGSNPPRDFSGTS